MAQWIFPYFDQVQMILVNVILLGKVKAAMVFDIYINFFQSNMAQNGSTADIDEGLYSRQL